MRFTQYVLERQYNYNFIDNALKNVSYSVNRKDLHSLKENQSQNIKREHQIPETDQSTIGFL